MTQSDGSSLAQSRKAYKAYPSQKQTFKAASRSTVDGIKAVDLRDLAPRILNAQPHRRGRKHDTYNSEVIGKPERTPSLAIYADRFKNYGTGRERDDHITLAMLAWNCDFLTAVKGLADLIGLGSRNHRTIALRRNPAPKRVAQTEKLPTPAWQAAMIRVIEQAQHNLWNSPLGLKALEYLRSEGYTDAMIQQWKLGFNPKGHNVSISSNEDAWVAPGITYPWFRGETLYGIKVRCPHTTKDGKPDKLSKFTGMIPEKEKYRQAAGSRLGLTWYGNAIQDGDWILVCEGEKDTNNAHEQLSDVTCITLGGASSYPTASVIERLKKARAIISALDSDQAGQAATQELQDQLRAAGVTCPIVTASLPDGYKDITEFILAGGDIDAWWQNLEWEAEAFTHLDLYFQDGLPSSLVELLVSFSGLEWMEDDLAHLLAVWGVWHAAIKARLLLPHHWLTRAKLAEVSSQLGHPLTETTIRSGLDLLVKYGVWQCENFASLKSKPIQGCKNLRLQAKTLLYRSNPLKEGLAALVEHLEYEVPAGWGDWLPDECVPEFARQNIRDDRPITPRTEYLPTGEVTTNFINETVDLLNLLDRLKDVTALRQDAVFHPPEGFVITNVRTLRGALLRWLHDHNAQLPPSGHGPAVWQVSVAELARRLGCSERSISAYRIEAQLATQEDSKVIPIAASGNMRAAIEKAIGKRQGGVRIHIGSSASYLTPQNREQLLQAAATSDHPIWVEIQLPSKQYVASKEEIEAQREARQKRHQVHCQRSQASHQDEGENKTVPTPTPIRATSPKSKPATHPVMQAKTPGYSRLYIYHHLLRILPELLKVIEESPIIAALLDEYGLSPHHCPSVMTPLSANKLFAVTESIAPETSGASNPALDRYTTAIEDEKVADGKRYRRGESRV